VGDNSGFPSIQVAMTVGLSRSAAGPCPDTNSGWWTAFGLAAIFSSRFIIQWLHSEKKKELIVPPIFWHLSFWGSVISLLYAVHVDKLPIILSFAFLPFLYARNLVLLRRRPATRQDS
jgi:lipid-A-disaccharide synthase-like uncharacterized protein